jgi:hypothetical protein
LSRGEHHTIRAEAQGFRRASVYVENAFKWWVFALDFVGTGAVGVLVDAVSGGWYGLEPTEVSLALEREVPEVPRGFTAAGWPRRGDLPTPLQPREPGAAVRFCSSCGARLEERGAFCPACGARQ